MQHENAALAQRNRELTIPNTIAHQLNGSADLRLLQAVGDMHRSRDCARQFL
jgi:hypothetical protein